MSNIKLENGKYEFIYNEKTGDFKCLRNGEEWRDFTGDKAVWSLFNFCQNLTLRDKNLTLRDKNPLTVMEAISLFPERDYCYCPSHGVYKAPHTRALEGAIQIINGKFYRCGPCDECQ